MHSYSYLLGYETGLEKVGMFNPEVCDFLKEAGKAGRGPVRRRPSKTKKVDTPQVSEVKAPAAPEVPKAPEAAKAPEAPKTKKSISDKVYGWTARHPKSSIAIGAAGTAAGIGAGLLASHHDK